MQPWRSTQIARTVSPESESFRLFPRISAWLRGGALDERLAGGASPSQSPELSARARWLTSTRTRRRLAQWIQRVIEAAETPYAGDRGPAVPLEREAIRRTRTLLLSLARELDAVDEPASPRGIARVRQLLTDGASPLYINPNPFVPRSGLGLEGAVRHARATLALG